MKIERLPNRDFNNKVIPEVGSKIRKAREECGLSQKELGELMGFNTATAVSLIESNLRGVSAIQLWKVSQITNLPITFFI